MSVGSESPEPLTTATSGDASIAPQSIAPNAVDVLWKDLRAAFSELTIFGKPADPAKLSIVKAGDFANITAGRPAPSRAN